MLAAERVLLYALSVALGALLAREISRPPAPLAASLTQRPDRNRRATVDASNVTLSDGEGTPRLVLSLNSDGSPRLVLNDAKGQSGIELSLTNDGTSQLQMSRGDGILRLGIDALGAITCRLSSGETRQQMTVDASGAAEWRMSGKATDPEGVIRLDPVGNISWEFLQVGRSGKMSAALDKTGQAALQLIGDKKTFAQMFLAATGEVEIGVGGGPHGIEALLRTDQSGAAEVTLTSPEHSGGPRLSMLPNGEMGVRVLGQEGQTGPVMQLLKDGSAEITIVDARSQRGPVMFRGKDGTSLIGIRGEKGRPGPRLYQGPNQKSLIALPGLGQSQVGMYADDKSPSFLVVTGIDGRAVALWPADAHLPAEPTDQKAMP
jgi:hypothetical protein